jgi:hypothetical protein
LVALLLAPAAARGDEIDLKSDPDFQKAWTPTLGPFVRTKIMKIATKTGMTPTNVSYLRGQILNKIDKDRFLFRPYKGSGTTIEAADPVPVNRRWIFRLKQEVDTDLDLYALLSNRRAIYKSAEDADRELMRAIDGGHGVWMFTTPEGPKQTNAPALLEGSLVRYLSEGPITTPDLYKLARRKIDEMNARLAQDLQDPFERYATDPSPEDVMTSLVEAYARAMKYGRSPERERFTAFIRDIAWLMNERLAGADAKLAANVKITDPGPGGVAARCRAFALRSRAVLLTLVDAGAGDGIVGSRPRDLPWPCDPEHPQVNPDAEMPLTGADISASAIALVASLVKPPGGGDPVCMGLVTPREDASRVLASLLRVANGSGQLSDQALIALWQLADEGVAPFPDPPKDLPSGARDGTYRGRLVALVAQSDPNKAQTAQKALIFAGVQTKEQAAAAVQDLLKLAIPANPPSNPDQQMQRDTALRTLWYLRRRKTRGTDNADARAQAAQLVDQRREDIRARAAQNNASPMELEFLKATDSGT